jgi:hypothetical protein
MTLLDLSFLEQNVLADDRIVLAELELVRRIFLVLRRGVEKAGIRRGNQLDLVAFFLLGHGLISERSDRFATGADFRNDRFNAEFVDDAHAIGGYAELDEALLGIHPEAMRVQIRQKPAPTPVVGVRDGIADHRLFAGYLADSGHGKFAGR